VKNNQDFSAFLREEESKEFTKTGTGMEI
jgi:hypothetical protein